MKKLNKNYYVALIRMVNSLIQKQSEEDISFYTKIKFIHFFKVWLLNEFIKV